MRLLHVLCVVFLVPVIGVAANDAYMYYQELQQHPDAPFHFSELGYVWYHYSKETHDTAVHMAGAETWNEVVKPILKRPLMLYAAAPEALFLLLSLSVWLYERAPTTRIRRAKEEKAFAGTQHKGKKISYNRK